MRNGLPEPEFDAVIVGAGFAGLYMLHSLREAGLSAVVYDAAPEVGGYLVLESISGLSLRYREHAVFVPIR